MSNDTMQIFDNWLREWCEQRGWPYQPEVDTAEQNAQEFWASVNGTDEWEMAKLTEIEENND